MGQARIHGRASRPTSATRAPTCSAPSARRAAPARRWPCPSPTPRPCSFISTRSPAPSPGAPMPSCCSTGPAGTPREHLAVPKNITPDPPAVARPGAEPGREHLAVPARELALQPRLRHLRGHHRRRLRRLAQAPRPARNDHLHRPRDGPGRRSRMRADDIIRVAEARRPGPWSRRRSRPLRTERVRARRSPGHRDPGSFRPTRSCNSPRLGFTR